MLMGDETSGRFFHSPQNHNTNFFFTTSGACSSVDDGHLMSFGKKHIIIKTIQNTFQIDRGSYSNSIYKNIMSLLHERNTCFLLRQELQEFKRQRVTNIQEIRIIRTQETRVTK